jgi:hypothetical protein
MVQKDAFSCGPDPSILDNRSVRGGSRDPLKSIKNLTETPPIKAERPEPSDHLRST